MSFAIFIRDAEIVFTAPLLSTKASCAAYLSQKKNKKKQMRTHSDEIIQTNQYKSNKKKVRKMIKLKSRF